jgi:hypothetical protein
VSARERVTDHHHRDRDRDLMLRRANVKACLLGSAQRDAAVERDACNGKYNLGRDMCHS